MRVLISSEGAHEPVGFHWMVVDLNGMLVDLAQVNGTLHDPGIARVTWGLVQLGADMREGGTIHRTDGSRQHFFEMAPLSPYLEAFETQRSGALAVHQASLDEAATTAAFGPVVAKTL